MTPQLKSQIASIEDLRAAAAEQIADLTIQLPELYENTSLNYDASYELNALWESIRVKTQTDDPVSAPTEYEESYEYSDSEG